MDASQRDQLRKSCTVCRVQCTRVSSASIGCASVCSVVLVDVYSLIIALPDILFQFSFPLNFNCFHTHFISSTLELSSFIMCFSHSFCCKKRIMESLYLCVHRLSACMAASAQINALFMVNIICSKGLSLIRNLISTTVLLE